MNRRRFRVPSEGDHQETTARQYIARAWPEGTTEQVRALFDAGQVEADGIVATRPDRPLAAATVVEVELDEPGGEVFGLSEPETLVWGDAWVVVDKPIGIPGRVTDDPTDPIRFMADVLGLDREHVEPVWEMPTNAGGPWPIARTSEVAGRIRDAIAAGELQTTWVAISERPDHPQGRWGTDLGDIQFAATRTEGPLAELQLTPHWELSSDEVHQLFRLVADIMTRADHPALGDAQQGGYLVEGGYRLRLAAMYGGAGFKHSWSAPRQWWPKEEVVRTRPPEPREVEVGAPTTEVGELRITSGAAERLESPGAYLVRRNDVRDPLDRLAVGQPVRLVTADGPLDVFALIDDTDGVAARVFSRDHRQVRDLRGELQIRLDEAIGRRRAYFGDIGHNDAFRVVHGIADGLPGLVVERWASVWHLAFTARSLLGFRDRFVDWLVERDPDTAIFETRRLEITPGSDDPSATPVAGASSLAKPGSFQLVRDGGLRVPVDPRRRHDWLRIAYRDLRRLAAERAESGERWLNPFCHTGVFAAGMAREDVSTTNLLSGPVNIRRLERLFDINGIDADRFAAESADPTKWLENTDEMFDGIWLTAPNGANPIDERRFGELLEALFERLTPGGRMLVCEPGSATTAEQLEKLIAAAATDSERTIEKIEPAEIPSDFSGAGDFPGRAPFAGHWVKLQ